MTDYRRKAEIERQKQIGRDDFLAGDHRQRFLGTYTQHQLAGYDEAAYEVRRAAEDRVLQLRNFAQQRINDLPEGDEQYALQAIFDWIAVVLEKPEWTTSNVSPAAASSAA